jgi:hypothetical protein
LRTETTVRISNTCAGRRGGLDANVLSAYVKYAEEMEDLNASINSVYWCMFHKPPPDELGGCKLDDITWGKRKREYDVITWEAARQEARERVVEYDETCPFEREDKAAEMLGAAGRLADRYTEANDDPYAGVDMYISEDD